MEDAGGGKGKKAAKPVTAVQDCVITSVSVKPPDISGSSNIFQIIC